MGSFVMVFLVDSWFDAGNVSIGDDGDEVVGSGKKRDVGYGNGDAAKVCDDNDDDDGDLTTDTVTSSDGCHTSSQGPFGSSPSLTAGQRTSAGTFLWGTWSLASTTLLSRG